MSELQTVLQWTECNGVQYRIQVGPRPGSAHWNLIKEFKLPDETEWKRLNGLETRGKPTVSTYE